MTTGYFNPDSKLSLREQHAQRRAERLKSGKPSFNPALRQLDNLDPTTSHNREEIRRINERGGSLSVKQNSSLPFSAAFKNALVPYKLTEIESYDDAMNRLREMFGKKLFFRKGQDQEGNPILLINSPKPMKVITGNSKEDYEEAVMAYTNAIINTVRHQVKGESSKLASDALVSPAFQTYTNFKTKQLAKLVDDINKYKLIGSSEIKQDSDNPLLISFQGQNESDAIEVVKFNNFDLAIAALTTFKNDISDLRAYDNKADVDEAPKVLLTDLKDRYSSGMMDFLQANLKHLTLAA